ncbi:hypothetical protein TYRP_008476 [Tyrophagus putrescentiae]|nr:hypothetical protein TYRP_008476 [Tyrophagus putrescentiae]
MMATVINGLPVEECQAAKQPASTSACLLAASTASVAKLQPNSTDEELSLTQLRLLLCDTSADGLSGESEVANQKNLKIEIKSCSFHCAFQCCPLERNTKHSRSRVLQS